MDPTRRLRRADLLTPGAAAALVLWSAVTRRPLPWGPEATAAWLSIGGAWLLTVAVPLWLLPELPARVARRADGPLFAALAILLLAMPGIRAPAAAVLLLLAALSLHARSATEVLFRFSPVLMGALGYVELRGFLPAPEGATWDAALASVDGHVFGGAWSVALDRVAPPWLTDWFALHYASYLAYPVAAAILLWLARDSRAFETYAFTFALAMLAGDACYLLVPARGPRVFLAAAFATAEPHGGAITRAMLAMVGDYEYGYDVFPSLHVANAILAVWALRERFPRLVGVAVFCAANLIASTIWLRMHYTVDVAAGALLALAVHRVAAAVAWPVGAPIAVTAPARDPRSRERLGPA